MVNIEFNSISRFSNFSFFLCRIINFNSTRSFPCSKLTRSLDYDGLKASTEAFGTDCAMINGCAIVLQTSLKKKKKKENSLEDRAGYLQHS